MDTEEKALFAYRALVPYGARKTRYGNVPLVGVQGAAPDRLAVLSFYETEIVFEFSFHTAHFAADDLSLAVAVAEDFLTGKLCAVEFFLAGKSLFGGARNSSISRLNGTTEFCEAYAGGKGDVAEKIAKLLCRGDVSVKIRSFDGSADRDLDPPFEGLGG